MYEIMSRVLVQCIAQQRHAKVQRKEQQVEYTSNYLVNLIKMRQYSV